MTIPNLEEIKENHLKAIAQYLHKQKEEDNALKEKLENTEKTLEGCYSYIKSLAKKQASNGCAFIEDAEVYHWVREYFLEDSINHEPKKEEPKKEKHKKDESASHPQASASQDEDDEEIEENENTDLNEEEEAHLEEDEQEVISTPKVAPEPQNKAKTESNARQSLFDFDF